MSISPLARRLASVRSGSSLEPCSPCPEWPWPIIPPIIRPIITMQMTMKTAPTNHHPAPHPHIIVPTSLLRQRLLMAVAPVVQDDQARERDTPSVRAACARTRWVADARSEEHTSELQSRRDLVCRLLLEKKKKRE